ncbi:hypothetical protein DL766_006064 [Monosporascus sp. MC13-8B]|uniref:DUF1993 domain-containing protein n=1 Tax=Monosporascus cannonballus TaxID=155416 RepID=A0ABY0GR37_9PEZI|nr:hypothetical protein DL762_010248 [Monosporascus cannonballus]RYO96214.1 hypothetical protein DL763_003341 [Monosporascus cannonballus]RYP28071.1 hypothetical protein DL766_006064 [Monosporascus sp. MC13-8B]
MSSLYSVSIPVLLNILAATSHVLKKGGEHAREKGIAISEYLDARIAEDMLPLRTQVHIVCSTARKAVERLTGAAPPALDLEAERPTLEEWLAVVDETAEMLRAVDPAAVDGKEQTRVPCVFGPEKFEAPLADYVHGYPVPTAYFHLSMIYAILRGKGVPLGKVDYMTPFMQSFTKV